LPEVIDTYALLPAAKQAGVVYAPGQIFLPNEQRSSALRVSLATASVSEIERGVRILGEVARAALPRRSQRDGVRASAAIHV
jgi:2-aminoadipate transaminase